MDCQIEKLREEILHLQIKQIVKSKFSVRVNHLIEELTRQSVQVSLKNIKLYFMWMFFGAVAEEKGGFWQTGEEHVGQYWCCTWC